MYDRKPQNSVKQLSFNLKINNNNNNKMPGVTVEQKFEGNGEPGTRPG